MRKLFSFALRIYNFCVSEYWCLDNVILFDGKLLLFGFIVCFIVKYIENLVRVKGKFIFLFFLKNKEKF